MAVEESDDSPKDLFKDVTFYIVGDISEDVISKLTEGGGKRDNYLCEMVTHVIADDVTNHEYQEARELFELPCVMSDWVLLSVKCKRLLDKELFTPEGRLFSGVVACVSQVEEQDWLLLWGLIVYYGGRCQGNLTSQCTHLITAAKEGAKYEAALEHSDSIKIVTPDWVTDCVKNSSRQEEKIYHPRLVVYPKPESPPKPATLPRAEPMEVTTPTPVAPVSEEAPRPPTDRRQTEEETRTSRPNTPSAAAKEALARMVNHRMQDFPPQRPPPVAPGIQQKLRNITNNIDVHKRQGRPPSQKINPLASDHPHASARHPPPSYYMPPVPIGLPFPPQQPQAPSWPTYWGHDPADNVPLDLCLLGCIFYITDYPKIVGPETIAIWKEVIEQHGGQVDPSYSNRVTHVLCYSQRSDVFHLALRDQRRVVTAYWLNDVLLKKKMQPPWQALHLPLLYSGDSKPCSDQLLCITNFEDEDRDRVKEMIKAIGAKYTGCMSISNSALVCKGPEGKKYQMAKDWRIPVVNVLWLSDLILGHMDALKLPIHNKYLQVGHGDEFVMDMSKVQHLLVAWQTPLKVAKEWKKFMPSKRKLDPAPGQENLPDTTSTHSAAKKKRTETPEETVDLNRPGPRVTFTGFQIGVKKRLQALVAQLGGTVVENPKLCTHLVAPSFSRTMKFFVAINVCHHVVTSQWLEDSFQQNHFLSESSYVLQDASGELELKCSLQESLRRARTRPLFAGMTFSITPSVYPSVDGLQKIVESAGGTVSTKKRPKAKTIETLVDDQGNPTFIVITCDTDIHLCEDLIARNIRVYTSEFILMGVLRQEKNYKQFQIEFQ